MRRILLPVVFLFFAGLPLVGFAQTVASVTAPAGPYKAGQTVNITVTYTGFNVDLDVSGGVPTMTLNTTPARSASCTTPTSSNLTSIVFSYTVQTGDVASRLDYTATTAIALNGGTIKKAGAGSNADNTLPAVGTSGLYTTNIVVDGVVPTITAATISPSSGSRKVGDVVTVVVTAGGAETGLTQGAGTTINGQAPGGFTDNADGTYSLTYTVAEGNANWAAGAIPINIILSDAAGNLSTARTTYTANTLSGDANTPTITAAAVSPSSGSRKVGDVVTVTITAGSAETGLTQGSGSTINGQTPSGFVDNANGTYTFSYTLAEGNPNWAAGAIPISLKLADAAGNVSTARTTYTANTLSGDANTPTITAAAVSPSSGSRKVGDVVTVTVTAGSNETGLLQGSGSTINGQTPSGFVDNTDGTYTFSYTVAEGNSNWAAGAMPISLKLVDAAGNLSTARTTYTANTLSGDANTPTITAAVVSPSSGSRKVGNVVTVTVTAGSNETGLSQGAGSTINGQTPGGFVDNADGTYTFSYTVAEGNANWSSGSIPISLKLADAAGNLSTARTTYTANTLSGDGNTPTITTATVSPASGNAKVGDNVVVTIHAGGNETGLSAGAGSTINGASVTGTFADIGGGNYTFTYTVTEGASTWALNGLPFSLKLVDAAGNLSTAVTAVTSGGTCSATDTGTPTITTVTVSPNTGNAKIGDNVVISVHAGGNETGLVAGSGATVNGVSVTGTFAEVGGGDYTFTYTPSAGATTWTTNNLAFSVKLADAAGNTSTAATAVTSGGTCSGTDFTRPTVTLGRSAVTLGSFTGTTDNSISFTLAFSEVMDGTSLTTGDVSVTYGGTTASSGSSVSNPSADNQNFVFTLTGVTGDGTITITVGPSINDAAGNAMLAATGPSSGITMDNTAPAAGTVGAVAAITNGRLVSLYFNSTNDLLQVTVPLTAGDATEDNGSVQVKIRMTGGAFTNVPNTGLSTITNAERLAGTKNISIAVADLITAGMTDGNSGGLRSAETKFLEVTAAITDNAGNVSSNLTTSATQLDIDRTAPALSSAAIVVPGAGSGGRDVIEFTVNEPLSDHAATPAERGNNFAFVSAATTYGSTGLSVGGGTTVGTTDQVDYVYQGATNSIVSSFVNVHLVYVESTSNAATWSTTAGTSIQYVRAGTSATTALVMRDPAGNELANQTIACAAGATTSLAAATALAGPNLNNSSTTQAVFAFSLTASSATTLSAVSIIANANPANLIKSGTFKLYTNSTNNYATATPIVSTPTVASSAPYAIDFTGLSVSLPLSTPVYFFLMADVADYFFSANPTIGFSMTANSLPNATGGFTVAAGGYSGSTVTGTTYTLKDLTAPSILSITNSQSVIKLGNLTQTVAIKFSEPMNNATSPGAGSIGISGTANWGAFSGGAWSTGSLTNDTYTVTIVHNGTAQTETVNSFINATSGIQDFGTNANPAGLSGSTFLIDTRRPQVASISTNLSTVNLANPTVRVSVRYDETMNTSAAPTISFSSGTFGSATPVSGAGYTNGWKTTILTNDTYEIDYTNSTTNEEFASVTVSANSAQDAVGNAQNVLATSSGFLLDTKAPTVSSVTRNSATPTNASSLSYDVTFSESVTNIDVSDFALTTTGTASANILSVSGLTGTTVTVNLNNVTGDGTIRLDVKTQAGGATLADAGANPVVNGFTAGEVYSIDHTAPSPSSIDISSPIASFRTELNGISATSITWLVTFSEDVTGVDATDFTINSGASMTYTGPLVITGSNNTRTVTMNGVSLLNAGGAGQVKINLSNDLTIKDLAGNNLTAGLTTTFTGNDFYTIFFPEPTDAAINLTTPTITTTSISVKFDPPAAPTTPIQAYFVQQKKSTAGSFLPALVDGVWDGGVTPYYYGSVAGMTVGLNGLMSGVAYDIKVVSTSHSGFYTTDVLDYNLVTTLDGTATTNVASSGTLTKISAPSTISSLTTASNGIPVLTFSINEDGAAATKGADNAPLKISQLVVSPGTTNTVGNWNNAIAGAQLTDTKGNMIAGVVGPTSITFSSLLSPTPTSTDAGFITDDTDQQYVLRVWLKTTLGVADNSILDFRVNNSSITPYHDDTTPDSNGDVQISSKLAGGQQIESNAVRIDVYATKLVFNVNPQPQIGVGTSFNQSSQAQPKIYAQDTNGNLDTDYNATFAVGTSIAESHTGLTAFSSGVLTLSTFKFTAAGSSTITISGNAVTLPISYPALTGANAAVSSSVTAVISNLTTITDGPTTPATELASFSSLTNAAPGSYNFDFTISDDVGVDATDFVDNDGLPTIIQTITISQGSNNGDNSGGADAATFDDWTKSIAGATLTDGINTTTQANLIIGTNSLQFTVTGTTMQTIADGGTKTYQLRIWLRNSIDATLVDILDNKDYSFTVTELGVGTSLTPNTTSALTASSASTNDGRNVVTVTATQLDFITQWAASASQNYDAPLSPSPVAKARDANGNLDLNYNTAATVAAAGNPGGPGETYPLANSTVTVSNGILTFDPSLQVTSAGGGTKDQLVRLTVSSGGLTPGVTVNCKMAYSGNSDVVHDHSTYPFTHPTDILYANAANQGTGGATTNIDDNTEGTAMEQFVIRDGGGSPDADGSPTVLGTVTFAIKNAYFYQSSPLVTSSNLRSIALFIGNNATPFKVLSAASMTQDATVKTTGHITFTLTTTVGSADFSAPDNGTLQLTIRASYNTANVVDNTQIQFDVEAVTSGGVSSSFGSATLPTGTLTASQNLIEVVAAQIDITSPSTASGVSINTDFPGIVAEARDANLNRDVDFTGIITALTNTTSRTMANGPTIGTSAFAAGVYNFSNTFQFTSGVNGDNVTLSMKADNTGGNSGTTCGTNAICSFISPTLTLLTSFESSLQLDPTFSILPRIAYVTHQEAANIQNTSTSYELVRALLIDGSRSASFLYGGFTLDTNTDSGDGLPDSDNDGASTNLTSLTLRITNASTIRRIALYSNGTEISGTEVDVDALNIAHGASYDFVFNGSPLLTAADNSEAPLSVRVSFMDNATDLVDGDDIQLQLIAATVTTGSQFFNGNPANSGVGGPYTAGGPANPPAQSMGLINVVATSLDFTTQPSAFAGINEKIGTNPVTSTPYITVTSGLPQATAGIVEARDANGLLDLEFTYPVGGFSVSGGTPVIPRGFVNGVLDLNGMYYTVAGSGKLTVTANSISSNTVSSSNSKPCNNVDVIHTGVIDAGSSAATNLKGGTSNNQIFGITFKPDYSTTAQPYLKKFTIAFDNAYKTSTSVIFKNFVVRQNGSDVKLQAGNTVTEKASSLMPAGSFDLIEVDLSANPVPLFNPSTGAASPATFYLSADVDITAKVGTTNLTPMLVDNGFNLVSNASSATDNFIVVSNGTAKANVVGKTYSFASTRPPVLLTDKGFSDPYNGQLNVDKNLTQIKLEFDVRVWSLDDSAELWDRTTNVKVADLKANNSDFVTNKTLDAAVTPLIFDIQFLPGYSFVADGLYYVTIKKGTFDNKSGLGEGISDDGFNYYGGISSNNTLFFKISSEIPPDLMDASSVFNNLTTGTFNTTFDQRGTAYYLVLDHAQYVATGSVPPTIADIANPTTYAAAHAGTVIKNGSYAITLVNAAQTVTYNANLTAGATYDLWIYAQNDAQPTPVVVTNGPYGGSAFDSGQPGPTLQFTLPTAGNIKNSYSPAYAICPDSYVTVSEPIIIGETNSGDFGVAGGPQNFNLLLPTGFQFDGVNKPTVQLIGPDFVGSATLTWVNNTIINISYTNTNTTNVVGATLDQIIISNLRVKGVGGSDPGVIRRFAGTANLAGAINLASIENLIILPQSFTNSFSEQTNFVPFGFAPNDIVTTIPDNFTDNLDANLQAGEVRLIPIITPANDYGINTFSGNGVTNDVLSLGAVALNSAFDITMTHTDLNGCISNTTVQHLVYDHTVPISVLLGATGGTEEALLNSNFPANASPTPVTAANTIGYKDKAGYKLLLLKADIPVDAGSQLISGPAWQAQLDKVLTVTNTITPAMDPDAASATSFNASLTDYHEYSWDYSHILNAVSESGNVITQNPYDNFKDAVKNFWRGGSLGRVRYTGTFHNTADLTVVVPFSQDVELFVPPIPLIEIASNNQSSTDLADAQTNNFDAKTPAQRYNTALYGTFPGVPVFCEAGGIIRLNGFPAATAGSSIGTFAVYDYASYNFTTNTGSALIAPAPASPFVDNGNGTATLDASSPQIKNNYKDIVVTYTFNENNSPATGTAYIVLRITPNPIASFTVTGPFCVSTSTAPAAITFNGANSNFGAATGFTNADINKYIWAYGDPKASQGNLNGDTTTTNAPVSHYYSQSARYNASLVVTSKFGCQSPVQPTQVGIGENPDVQFTFTGVSQQDQFSFISTSNVNASDPVLTDAITQLDWAFGDGGTAQSSGSTISNTATHTYSSPNKNITAPNYNVVLTATSKMGCVRSLPKPLVVLPSVPIAKGNEYFESFESSDGNWLVAVPPNAPNGAGVPSWGWGKATSATAQKPVIVNDPSINGNNVWKTNLTGNYNGKEFSAIYSPTLDLSNLDRPMVSFNSFVQMELGDGVIIEYSTDDFNILDSRKQWHVLGKNVGEGLAWFNGTSLGGAPGKQPVGQSLGWTGSSITTWQDSRHTIADESGKPPIYKTAKVVFRLALGSTNGSPNTNGFAFDNFRIGERTRIVLIENFTNLGNDAKAADGQVIEDSENTWMNSSFLSSPAVSVGSVVKMDYHVAFPKPDPLNQDNAQDPGARALYYSVSSTPRVRMDGQVPTPADADKVFSSWGTTAYSVRSLKLADAVLTLPTAPTFNADGSVSFSVNVKANKDLPANTVLNVALIEKSISKSSLSTTLQGIIKVTNTNYTYTVKRLLPNAAGTKFGTLLANNSSRTFGPFVSAEKMTLYAPSNDLAVVVFLQDETSKEVYQTEIFDLTQDPSVVTSIEDINSAFNVYPNPADRELTIELPETAVQRSNLQMFDQLGKVVHQSAFEKGDSSKTINTESFAGGVYIIQIETAKGLLRRKVMVLHHN